MTIPPCQQGPRRLGDRGGDRSEGRARGAFTGLQTGIRGSPTAEGLGIGRANRLHYAILPTRGRQMRRVTRSRKFTCKSPRRLSKQGPIDHRHETSPTLQDVHHLLIDASSRRLPCSPPSFHSSSLRWTLSYRDRASQSSHIPSPAQSNEIVPSHSNPPKNSRQSSIFLQLNITLARYDTDSLSTASQERAKSMASTEGPQRHHGQSHRVFFDARIYESPPSHANSSSRSSCSTPTIRGMDASPRQSQDPALRLE